MNSIHLFCNWMYLLEFKLEKMERSMPLILRLSCKQSVLQVCMLTPESSGGCKQGRKYWLHEYLPLHLSWNLIKMERGHLRGVGETKLYIDILQIDNSSCKMSPWNSVMSCNHLSAVVWNTNCHFSHFADSHNSQENTTQLCHKWYWRQWF